MKIIEEILSKTNVEEQLEIFGLIWGPMLKKNDLENFCLAYELLF